MKLLLISLSFLTRLPIRINYEVSQNEFYKSMLLMPIVGLILGLIIYLISMILQYINYIPIRNILLLIIIIYLSGGLHLDGFADTIDGFFSSKNKEKTIAIMKDPHIGTFGVIGLILIIFSYYYVLDFCFSNSILFIIFPIIGRFCGIFLGAYFKASPLNNGLGSEFVKVDSSKIFLIYLIPIIILTYVLLKIMGIISLIITIILAFLEGLMCNKKIDGITGDTIGFTIETTQIFYIFIYIFLSQFRY